MRNPSADDTIWPTVTLPAWPIDTVRTLTGARSIWLAGGAVRDLVLGRAPGDWDFVVDRDALGLARAVADAMDGAYYPLDAPRGTGRAIVRPPGEETAVTLDFAKVRARDVTGDLRLRDFTINALALTFEGQLLDPTDGMKDIAARTIRVTEPGAFRRDPIRLVRAVRQAVELGFSLEPGTRQRLRAAADTIGAVAAERVRTELLKLLKLPRGSAGIRQLDQLGLLTHIVPELYVPPPTLGRGTVDSSGSDQVARIARLVDGAMCLARAATQATRPVPGAVPGPAGESACVSADLGRPAADLAEGLADLAPALSAHLATPVDAEVTRGDLIAWIAVFLRTGEQRDSTGLENLSEAVCASSAVAAEQALTRLRFSRAAVSFISSAVRSCWTFDSLVRDAADRLRIHRYFRASQETGIASALLALADACAGARPDVDAAWRARVETLRSLSEAYLLHHDTIVEPSALLGGDDFIALGVAPGPVLGKLIEALCEAQAAGEVSSRQEALAWATKAIPSL